MSGVDTAELQLPPSAAGPVRCVCPGVPEGHETSETRAATREVRRGFGYVGSRETQVLLPLCLNNTKGAVARRPWQRYMQPQVERGRASGWKCSGRRL